MSDPRERRTRRRRVLAAIGALLLAVAWRLPTILRGPEGCDDPADGGIDVPCRGMLSPGTDVVLVPGFRVEVVPMEPLEVEIDLDVDLDLEVAR